MHKEAGEELRVRLKLAVLELAHDLGVTKPAGNSTWLVQAFTGGNRNTRKQDDLDCIEKDPLPIAILAERRLKLWTKSWQYGPSIKSEPYELCIIWTVTTGSRSQSPR
jgi:hypothetical protein